MISSLKITLAAAIFASAAQAQPVVYDMGVDDEASFQVFRDAMYKSEYVRVEYAKTPNPRVVASVTALMVFSTNNPNATTQELTNFLDSYSAEMALAFLGDEDLQLGSSFFAAVRKLDRGAVAFDGTGLDTRVSARLLEVLDVAIPAPLDFTSTQKRMVKYENARLRSFTDAPEWSMVLLLALKGQDLDGVSNSILPGIVSTYLVNEGYDPVPSNPNAGVFQPVTSALSSMPVNFTGYSALLSEVNASADIDGTALQTNLNAQFVSLGNANLSKVNAIKDAMDPTNNPPTVIEAAENGTSEIILEAQIAEYDQALRDASDNRAEFQWNTMLLLQSDQESARMYGSSARDFSHIQLETDSTLTKVKLGVQVASSSAQLGIAIASGEPGDAVGAASDLIINSLDLADEFGAFDSPPPPEEQIFDQLVQVREDINELRLAMDERFDQIEVQLNTIYTQINSGFNQIGMDIGDLQTSVDAISLSVIEQQAALERLEDALFGLASDALWLDLANQVDLVLNYRSGGSDLPYETAAQNYIASQSQLGTFSITGAAGTAYAGSTTPELTSFDDALTILGGSSIGNDINNLRTFPGLGLGQSNLFPTRVVGAAPWTQGASVYTQLAQESRWYFAYLYENQLMSAGTPDLDAIIERGNDLIAMMENGRDAVLFEAMLDGYQTTINNLSNRESTLITQVENSVRPPNNIPGSANIDMFGGLTQPDVQLTLPSISQIIGVGPSGANLPMPNNPNAWNLFMTSESEKDIAPLTFAFVYDIAFSEGRNVTQTYEWNMNLLTSGGNEVLLNFGFTVDGNPAGQDLGLRVQTNRQIHMRISDDNGIDPYAFDDSQDAERLLGDNIGLWINLRNHLLSDERLTGQNLLLPGGPNGSLTLFEIVYDVGLGAPTFPHINGRPKAIEFLQGLQSEAWFDCRNDSSIIESGDELLDWHILLGAYSSLSMPDMIAGSTVAASALRGIPSARSFAINVNVDTHYAANGLFPSDAVFIADRLQSNIDAFRAEVDAWVSLPFLGHGYINYILAELNELSESAFDLAIDDRYESGQKLDVSVDNGLLANDVDQRYRTIEVASNTQPKSGSLVVNPDGSFVYIADDIHAGTVSFDYTSRAQITDINGNSQYFESNPATVVININPFTQSFIAVPSDCPTIALAIDLILDDPNSVIELAPGSYNELINTQSKAFTLRSASGNAEDTIISGWQLTDPDGYGRVITINSGEGRDTVIQDVTISDGRGFQIYPFAGAGMLITDAEPTVRGCIFKNNFAFNLGGGIAISGTKAPLIVNCLFYDNTSRAGGAIGTFEYFGGAVAGAGDAIVVNCTFVGNQDIDGDGGAMFFDALSTNSFVANSVLWGNTPDQIVGSGVDIRYSVVQDGVPAGVTDGGGNISADPQLVNPNIFGGGDFRIGAGSQAIDAGDSTQPLLAGILTDLGSDARFIDDLDTPDSGIGSSPIIDMGAYEFQGAEPCPADFTGDGIINFFDVSAFLQLFGTQDPEADFTDDGIWNFFDVSAFLQAFAAGCP